MAFKLLNHKELIPNVFQPDVSSRTRGHDQKLSKSMLNQG